MQIAIVGTGAIGSTFAVQLSNAGHAVTAIARGARLEQLQRDRGVITRDGKHTAVGVSSALDTTTPWDLVLVTVRAPQVDSVLPAVQASAAKTVMFMFNTFEPLDGLRDAVGASRFAFGFPGMFSALRNGKLQYRISTRGQLTTVTAAAWAKVFSEAGIPTVVHEDMHSWLRTHAAFVAPLLALSCVVHSRGGSISWIEADRFARALSEGFRVVRQLGNTITPKGMVTLSRMPTPVVTLLYWSISRTNVMREVGAPGPGEARMLIDQMTAASAEQTAVLRAIRP
jgi:2-dehydropantoate 2-reductase